MRELKNTVERSLFRWNSPDTVVEDIIVDPFQSPWDEPISVPVTASSDTIEPTTPPPPVDFSKQMDTIEKDLVQRALAEHAYNQRLTASTLGLSYDQLRGLVRKHGLSSRKRRQ